jgi:hypothetical protein
MRLKYGLTACAAFCLWFALQGCGSNEPDNLAQDSTVQGYPCAKGRAWFYKGGRLRGCTLSDNSAFGQAQVEKGSIIYLREDGTPLRAMLLHASTVAGTRCAGAGLLGPQEGSVTEFYPDGHLKLCFLPEDAMVQGVPCARGGFWKAAFSHEYPVELDEHGRLMSCGLARDFDGHSRGQKYVLAD